MADQPAPQGMTEEDLRELLMRGEALRQQMTQLEGQRELVSELASEARRALTTLEALTGAKDGDEMLVPLGAGQYVHARVANAGRAISAIGAGLHADVPVEQARTRLEARAESLESALTQLSKELQRLTDEMARVNAVAESAYGG